MTAATSPVQGGTSELAQVVARKGAEPSTHGAPRSGRDERNYPVTNAPPCSIRRVTGPLLELRAPIRTARLTLRPFAETDLGTLFAIQSDPEVVRWLYVDVRDRGEVMAALQRRITSTVVAAEGDSLYLAADRQDTGELVAELVLSWVSRDHATGELGFTVHPAHQGQGYATEGGEAMLQLAFEGLGLHRVIGRMEARNVRSARVMEKLGMRREAHLIENEWVKGEWQSELDYAILEQEWREQARMPG